MGTWLDFFKDLFAKDGSTDGTGTDGTGTDGTGTDGTGGVDPGDTQADPATNIVIKGVGTPDVSFIVNITATTDVYTVGDGEIFLPDLSTIINFELHVYCEDAGNVKITSFSGSQILLHGNLVNAIVSPGIKDSRIVLRKRDNNTMVVWNGENMWRKYA